MQQENAAHSNKRVSVTLFDQELNNPNSDDYLLHQLGATRFRDAYHLQYQQQDAFLFEYGVLVTWDIPEEGRKEIYSKLAPLLPHTDSRPSTEQYSYHVEPNTSFSVRHDHLILPDNELLTRLGLSHAFAQAAQLEFFESKAQSIIQKHAYISRELAETGKVSLDRKALAKLRGQLFDTASDITLHFGLLDTPEFFWDYPQLEEMYYSLSKYLDLQPRIEILNKKLETIEKLLDMLATEQHHKHSSFLEWIIIILIAVDILVYFF